MPHLVSETPHGDQKPGQNLLLDCHEEKFAQVAQGAKCSGRDAQFAVVVVQMLFLLLFELCKLLFLLLFELCNVGVSPLHGLNKCIKGSIFPCCAFVLRLSKPVGPNILLSFVLK